VLKDGLGLILRDAREPLEEFVQAGSGLEVLEESLDRHASPLEHPGAAHLVGLALDGCRTSGRFILI
jgi:hypothetical protein